MPNKGNGSKNTSTILLLLYQRALKSSMSVMLFISYLSYYLHCCTLPDKRCLSHGMNLYQVMMTLHFLNDVANDAESIER